MSLGPGPAALPPGYPEEYRQETTLHDGRRVLIRPILPSDAPELARAITTADPDTLRRRFLGGPPRVTPELMERLTVLDYQQRFALVAFDTVTGRGVAVARYELTGEGLADIAVAVQPGWRSVGLATVLILLLARAATERGIHTFSASYLAENRPVAALVADAKGLGSQFIEQGIADFSFALDRPATKPPLTDGTGGK
ncbi:MAG TPA: GNAT family N-acetyltransferase [Streptosporangiaceae bacterium]|nr:GNAT family N-acetyltransferase [Streptosporangiaceae bacterium]